MRRSKTFTFSGNYGGINFIELNPGVQSYTSYLFVVFVHNYGHLAVFTEKLSYRDNISVTSHFSVEYGCYKFF